MDYLEQFIDFYSRDIDPERFVISLAIRYICRLITHGGSDIGRADDDSALQPDHLEAFLTRAIEIIWKDKRFAQEWRNIQQLVPRSTRASEKDAIPNVV